jgi:hypothetical protein
LKHGWFQTGEAASTKGLRQEYFHCLPERVRSWAQWFTPIIPSLRRLRQEDLEFEGNLSYIARLCLKKGRKK